MVLKRLMVLILAISAFNNADAQSKTIYLVRHAKSSHDNPELKDFDRPLTKLGHADAKLMATVLKRMGISPQIILASPSRRTQQTSEYFINALYKDYRKINLDSSLYRCPPTTLVHQLSQLNDKHNSVIVFGHNPATTKAANFFQEDTLFQNVPTCGIVAIEIKVDKWSKIQKVKGRLKFYEYPKKHKS